MSGNRKTKKITLPKASSGLKGKKVVLGEEKKKKKNTIKNLASAFTSKHDTSSVESPTLSEMMQALDETPSNRNFAKFANRDRLKAERPTVPPPTPKIPQSKKKVTNITPVRGNPRAAINYDDLDDDEDDEDDEEPAFPSRRPPIRDEEDEYDDEDDFDDEEDEFYDGYSEDGPPAAPMKKPLPPSKRANASYYDEDQGSILSSVSSVPNGKKAEMPSFKSKESQKYGDFLEEDFDVELAQEAEKADILRRLEVLQSKGVKVSKKYTMKSKLNELRMEIGRIERERQVAQHILMQQRGLMIGVAGVEKAVRTFAPQKIKQDVAGFSSYIHAHLDDYNGGFERLSEKFDGSIGRALSNPFLELAIVLARHCFEFFVLRQDKQDMSADQILEKYPAEVNLIATKLAKEMAQDFMKTEREKLWAEVRPYMQQTQQNLNKFKEESAASLHNMFKDLPPLIPALHRPVQRQEPSGTDPHILEQFQNTTGQGLQPADAPNAFQVTEESYAYPESVKIIETQQRAMNTRKGKDTKIRTIKKLDEEEKGEDGFDSVPDV